MQLPKPYKDKMLRLLNDEYEEYINSFSNQRYCGLRVNTLKTTTDDFIKKIDKELSPIPWCDDGYYYDESEFRPAKSPYYHAGLYYIQEPSAMSPASLLEITKDDFVLDMCAAPGGKSTHIATKLNASGLLVSNDISTKRICALTKNIELFGITNAIVLNEDPIKLSAKFPSFFDKILVDAPCSGEGMFRKDPNIIKVWEENKTYQKIQMHLLKNAALMTKPNGMIMYSTCTFDPRENEEVIQHFLNTHSNFDLLPIPNKNLFDDGRPEWIDDGKIELKNCARLWPHKIKGEGHFLALLKKKCQKIKSLKIDTANKTCKSLQRDLEYYYSFIKEYMNKEFLSELKIVGNYLYSVPKGDYNLDGLRVMRFGLLLGELKTKRFEPSQALAMSIKKEDAKYTINFNINSNEIIKYLKGDTISIDGHDGWNLICVEGFPVGWGKLQNGRLKNKYLKSWKFD